MKVTRTAVFETNSSSTHSISIEGGDYEPDVFPIHDGVCEVHPGEFGWERHTFHTPEMKASYCLTYVKASVRLYPGTDEGDAAKAQMLKDVLKAETGREVEFIPIPKTDSHSYEWGYIDHQSSDVCGRAFESKESLRDFIFNPKSALVTANDND